MNNRKIMYIIVIILCIIIGSSVYFSNKKDNSKDIEQNVKKPVSYDDKDFNIKLLKTVNSSYNKNYLISPYSIEIALNMLKEGANSETLDEFNNLLGNRKINHISNEDIGVANALFIKNEYKDYIEKDFYNKLVKDYASEVLYDNFTKPDVINNWVKEKTNQMIPKLIDKVDPNFVLGLANALAIDVKWQKSFECDATSKEGFRHGDKVVNVEMMHSVYKTEDFKYFDTNKAKGVILPYEEKDGVALEFVGILPNEEVSKYIEGLTQEELTSIDTNIKKASIDLEIHLSLPRFSYDFTLDNFKEVLNALGINKAFDKDAANFTKMISKANMQKNRFDNLYVGEAIHKTKIELNEKGTKAAAVTYFGMFATSAIREKDPEIISIKFDKPFMYMIREKNTKELLFTGVVYEPNIWNGTTCSSIEE